VDVTAPVTRFAEWIVAASRDWSDLALTRAEDAVIDTVAVMVPGAFETVTRTLTETMFTQGRGPVTLIGRGGGLPVIPAALVGGTAAHALDFDDNFDPAKAHASAVLVPALLALAADRDLDTTAVLDAYIVGLQIMGRTGQGVNPYHRSRGWHATGTLGTIGAAAGCARLLQLDAARTACALSLATSMAGGFMSQFGTMAKPLHAGLAAEGGVKAALFAEAGITAGLATFDGPTGLRTLMVGPDSDDLADGLPADAEHGQAMRFVPGDVGIPLHIEDYGLKVKRFPNCGSVHRALDGLLELRDQHGLDADSVTAIHVRAPAAHLRNLMYDNPSTDMQAKFSLEYNLAAGLVSGTVGLDDFSDSRLQDADIRRAMTLVTKDYVDALESAFDTEVHITNKDGRTLSTSVHMPVGSTARPLSRDQLTAKARDCLRLHMSEAQTDSCMRALLNLGGAQKTRDLLDVCHIHRNGD